METIGVTDLYEAAFLLLNKCHFTGVECIPMTGTLGCSLGFANDEDIAYFQEQFQRREATVNLYAFRQAYNTVNGYVHRAKKSYEMAKKRTEGIAGGIAGGIARGIARGES